ncbi:MAG: hypothetical protein KZQ66_17525 [Candidatus Thiodiazotropha sp. (ex Lucinoma aequizonata)]|nr:hypothetical protein [Candidatus Thiodiazotropha sp. (ex Lucinoma aequizonata)]MCU7886882.1 hypothetical protein [Candidatus Thiodiazotropha sp. (ex Lucinoma aequizonata)]MCU7895808.1 hypothetical protein [Candidatus Thiodiazotropha sp. (ex Lucinoma aequizonata)]MCU7897332.1 hypothetical protein [Candidatus Thiodiazotropha sp. (ex Lucinoma aequizonata)]MCU7903560.1 hypothetical protein [Candidatus Thiodiazotropha sp. (ex Lucinoma aequizonata)]
MTYRSIKPMVRKVTKSYRKGVGIESRLERTTGLDHRFIKIASQSQTG